MHQCLNMLIVMKQQHSEAIVIEDEVVIIYGMEQPSGFLFQ